MHVYPRDKAPIIFSIELTRQSIRTLSRDSTLFGWQTDRVIQLFFLKLIWTRLGLVILTIVQEHIMYTLHGQQLKGNESKQPY